MDYKTFQHNAFNYSQRGRRLSAFMVSMTFVPVAYIYLHFSHFEFRNYSSWGGNTGDIMASIVMAMPVWFISLTFFMFIRWNKGGIVPKLLSFRPTDRDLREYFSDRRHTLKQRIDELDRVPPDMDYLDESKEILDEISDLTRHNQYASKGESKESIFRTKEKKKSKRKPRPNRPTKRWKK